MRGSLVWMLLMPATASAQDLGHAVDWVQRTVGNEPIPDVADQALPPTHDALPLIGARDHPPGKSLDDYRCSDTHLDQMVMRTKSIQRWVLRACIEAQFLRNAHPDYVTMGPPPLSPDRVRPLLDETAQRTGVPAELLEAVIRFSSGYRAGLVSREGHVGLMQLHPSHLSEMGLPTNDLESPARNILVGAHYLRALTFELESHKRALFAYRSGLGHYRATDSMRPATKDLVFVKAVFAVFYAQAREFPYDLGVDSMAHVLGLP